MSRLPRKLDNEGKSQKESLIISLRGWWNNERTAQRLEVIEGIIKELRNDKV